MRGEGGGVGAGMGGDCEEGLGSGWVPLGVGCVLGRVGLGYCGLGDEDHCVPLL